MSFYFLHLCCDKPISVPGCTISSVPSLMLCVLQLVSGAMVSVNFRLKRIFPYCYIEVRLNFHVRSIFGGITVYYFVLLQLMMIC